MKKSFLLIFIVLLFAGCATFMEAILDLPYYREYSGKPKSREDVAFVSRHNPYNQSISIHAIDGKKVYTTTGVFELLPGQHRITCTFCQKAGSQMRCAKKPETFTINVEAGKIYLININQSINESGWKWKLVLNDITDRKNDKQYSTPVETINKYYLRANTGKYKRAEMPVQ